jgi:hypothetical protein
MSEFIKEPWTIRFMKWLAQYVVGWTWVWQKVLFPIFRFFWRVYKAVSSIYMWIWSKLVYDDAGKFRRYRAGLTIVGTIGMLYIIPFMLFLAWQTTLYMTTRNQETIFLTLSQEIDPENDIHSIKGCEAIPCSEDNSVYYRVRPTTFHQFYAFGTRGSMFYPDLVASVVAPGYNKCEVHSYGIRVKTLMRKFDIYPDMLDAVCTPYERDK